MQLPGDTVRPRESGGLKVKLRESLTCFVLLALGSGCSAERAEPVASGNSTDAVAELAKRVESIEDRQAILDVLVRYGRLLDEKDLVGYSKLFADDGVWEGGIGSAEGPEGIQEMLETVFGRVEPGQYGADYHIMSDFEIDVDGDTATSRSHWTWIIEGDDGKPTAQRSGHYQDELVKIEGEWKFKHRLTVTELPTPENDAESQIFRKDHRDED
jgi:ketosteroid isomerase-like protein